MAGSCATFPAENNTIDCETDVCALPIPGLSHTDLRHKAAKEMVSSLKRGLQHSAANAHVSAL